MKKENIIQYLNKPELLDRDSLPQVEDLVRSYPWFQTARMMYLKNQHNLDSLKFHDELKFSAAYAGDRRILYHLIHDTTEQIQYSTEETPDPPVDLSPAVSQEELFLPEPGGNVYNIEDQDLPQETPSETIQAYSFTGWFDHISVQDKDGEDPGTKIPDGRKMISKQNDLIRRFIEEQPDLKPKIDPEQRVEDISKKSVEAGDSLITETLAKIYLRQGLFARAIYAYEKLSLKYPEKSAYFATQINHIRNLKENNT